MLKIWLDLIKVSVLDTNSNNPKDLECGLSCNTYKYPRIDVFSCTGMECVCVWTNQKFYKKGQRFCVFFSPSNLSTHLGFDKSFFFLVCFLSPHWLFFFIPCATDQQTIALFQCAKITHLIYCGFVQRVAWLSLSNALFPIVWNVRFFCVHL